MGHRYLSIPNGVQTKTCETQGAFPWVFSLEEVLPGGVAKPVLGAFWALRHRTEQIIRFWAGFRPYLDCKQAKLLGSLSARELDPLSLPWLVSFYYRFEGKFYSCCLELRSPYPRCWYLD